ncbi:B-box zinc finger protein 22-like isoform X3 [Cucurbita maxima]|uniref:B-box zinc finger protein 22-like isoform X3 n=1 Tax=Cucurbita maxima TaxID=3661 RepID=A0A6J1J3T1_CUCMA|nr:B-box zinc finger protein 22-like isoform X3 [Cucurbita maxima]
MKIQCNVCEMAEATVLCCADEAALCWACDENIHAANKLASKHQRVPLSGSSSQMPRCDICQEASGYIFCLEDRALFCRKCDVAIHTANTCVTGHQRFLLTGVKVALEPTDPVPCSSIANSHSREISTKTKVRPPSDKEFSMPSSGELSRSLSVQGGSDDFMTNRTLLTGDSASGGFSQWQIDELINLTGFNQTCGFMDNGSSKIDRDWRETELILRHDTPVMGEFLHVMILSYPHRLTAKKWTDWRLIVESLGNPTHHQV